MSAPSPWYKCCFSVETQQLDDIQRIPPSPPLQPSVTASMAAAKAIDARIQAARADKAAAAIAKPVPGSYSPRPDKRHKRLDPTEVVNIRQLFTPETKHE